MLITKVIEHNSAVSNRLCLSMQFLIPQQDVYKRQVLEGEWELEWDFTSYQQSKVIAVNQPIRINGRDKLITEVVISPISVCVYLQGDDKSTDTSINVNFDDGSCITYDPKNPNAFFLVYLMNEDEMIYEHMLYYRFESLIDVGTVESISINNMTIPLL